MNQAFFGISYSENWNGGAGGRREKSHILPDSAQKPLDRSDQGKIFAQKPHWCWV